MKQKFISNRSQKRAREKKIEKAFKKRKVVMSNESFENIKSELLKLGWSFDSEHNNAIEYEDRYVVTTSPSVKLFNEVFKATLIPQRDGIEISRIEVWAEYQCNGYGSTFLNYLLQFLIQKGIHDIYLIPLPAGDPSKISLFALNVQQLQKFYFKKGFRKEEGNKYWKLDLDIFQNYVGNMDIDYEILNTNFNPRSKADFDKRKYLKSQLNTIQIKTRIENSA